MIAGMPSSADLAAVLNAPPGITDDPQAVDPRDNSGVWVAGHFYPFDPEATTTTRAVLANGTAAVELTNGRWSPADTEEWTSGADPDIGVVGSGVTRDWRSVRVRDAGGFDDIAIYASREEAGHHYLIEVAKRRMAADEAAIDAREAWWRQA